MKPRPQTALKEVPCSSCDGIHDDPDSMFCSMCKCRKCGGRGTVYVKSVTPAKPAKKQKGKKHV